MKRSFLRIGWVVFWALFVGSGDISHAHVGAHPSVHDTVATILERMKEKMPEHDLRNLTVPKVEAFLTLEERYILGTEHLSFRVNVPVTLYLIRDTALGSEPFWLKDRGFTLTNLTVKGGSRTYDVWTKTFPEGWIGLGVNSLSGGGEHYVVALVPEKPGTPVTLEDIYPGFHTVGTLKVGEKLYTDRPDTFEVIPPELEGALFVRGVRSRRADAQMLNLWRFTKYPSSDKPDQIILTWSEDPKTTQTIQWRTSSRVTQGAVAYIKKSEAFTVHPKAPQIVHAETTVLKTPNVLNDPIVHRHTVTLRGLQPGTTYLYAVGDGSDEGWTEYREFTTAPADVAPFSFIYMGDAQNGLDRWGSLVHTAFRERPDAAFYIMAGDLVNRGAERDDWDDLFYNARDIYDRRTLVPVIGNHECQGGHPTLYLQQFALPINGPRHIEPERVYALEYSNALFVVLDSNLPPQSQAVWLEEVLSTSKATWKFVTYHHPAFSSAPNRDNKDVREVWGPIFDKYHVDLALQGHDHAYMRTYPLKGGQRVNSPKEGTIYIVSVSGTKMYEQVQRDYIEKGMTNLSTYQVLDIQISGNRLVYRAYDTDGKLCDEFVIEK